MRTFAPAIGKDAPLPPRTDNNYRERQTFYNSRRWRSFSVAFLAVNNLCVFCGRVAAVVDHIVPRLTSPADAFNPDNCRALCKACHSTHGTKHTPR